MPTEVNTPATEATNTPTGDAATTNATATPKSESSGLSTGVLLLSGAAFIVGVFILGNIIVNAVSGVVSSWNLPVGSSHILSMLYSVAMAALTGVAGFFIANRLNMPLKEMLFGIFNPLQIPSYLKAGAIGAVALLVFNIVVTLFEGNTGISKVFVPPYQVMNIPTLLASLGFTVVLAPIAEEMLFRGALLSLVRNSSFSVKALMVAISSFGFMGYHVAGAFMSAFQTSTSAGDFNIFFATLTATMPMLVLYFLSGVMLCLITLKTQNIYASWVAHAIYNMAILYGANTFILNLLPH